MNIFNETKELVKKERHYTVQILKNLMRIEKNKLYSDLKYPSLHKYLVRELGYSDGEAVVRANAVRLMLKSERAEKKIEKGEMSLTNASLAHQTLLAAPKEKKDKLIDEACKRNTRDFKDFVGSKFKSERKEVVVLREYVLDQFDRLRKKVGNLSTLELIQMMLERELKAPWCKATQSQRCGGQGTAYSCGNKKGGLYGGMQELWGQTRVGVRSYREILPRGRA